MKYIRYKESNGTIVPAFKVALYDIVIINTGYWKNELGIIVYIDEAAKRIKLRVIKCGMDLLLSLKNVTFVNHNNKTSAKSYIELCDKLSYKFKLKYTDIEYIKDNWDKDTFIINDITAVTIVEGINVYVGKKDSPSYVAKCLIWLADHKDIIGAVINYGDVDFVIRRMNISNNIINYELGIVENIYKLFFS